MTTSVKAASRAADARTLKAASPINKASELAAAYQFCSDLARTHYENFTIASWLMPRAMRPHMHAIYAYARIADDYADEDRSIAKLDAWEAELNLAYDGTPCHPVMVALADTVRRYSIPRQPFLDLLMAFRSDVNFQGFATLEDLLGYARCSANPVGRLVLYLFGYRDAERQQLSDLVCSGLQLANFWQDVAIDLAKGRIYLPREDMARFGVTAAELEVVHATPALAALLRHEGAGARVMLRRGAELFRLVDKRLARDVLMFAGGGLAILRAIQRVNYDVLGDRPQLSKFDYLRTGWNAWRRRLSA
jgi:squalene synthase HpnC